MTYQTIYNCTKVLLFASLIAVSIYAGIAVSTFIGVERRVDAAMGQLLDCTVIVDGQPKGNAACLQSQILAITGSTRATMGAVAKAAPDVALSIRSASGNSVTASQASVETAEAATALLRSATAATDELHATIKDLHEQVTELTQQVGPVLSGLVDLEHTLDAQIAEQSPEAGKTLKAMQALLEDPALFDTLKHVDGAATNVEDTTKNVAETTKTIDIATRDLRKKAGQIKWLIDKILGMIKVTVPLF